jgi:hypothetical protein
MKRIITIFVALAMAFSLMAGCTSQTGGNAGPGSPGASASVNVPNTPTDSYTAYVTMKGNAY